MKVGDKVQSRATGAVYTVTAVGYLGSLHYTTDKANEQIVQVDDSHPASRRIWYPAGRFTLSTIKLTLEERVERLEALVKSPE